MGPFKNTSDDWQRLDWQLLRDGWVTLYSSEDNLQEDLNWFKGENFQVVEFDAGKWTSSGRLHGDLMRGLNFPDYYGKNFDALNDCLSDLKIREAGMVVIFRHFQVVDKQSAHILLDIFAINARLHILLGNKLIILIQVDEPGYTIPAVGCCDVTSR